MREPQNNIKVYKMGHYERVELVQVIRRGSRHDAEREWADVFATYGAKITIIVEEPEL